MHVPRILLLGVLAVSASAATVTFQRGDLSLDFDDGTAGLTRIACGGQTLAAPSAGRSPLSLGIGPLDRTTWLEQLGPRRVVGHAEPDADTIAWTVRVGDLELVERYRLPPGQRRLDRSLTLVNRGTEGMKLRNVNFKTLGITATPDGFYRLPQQWPPRSHPFAALREGVRHGRGHEGVVPLVAQLTPHRSLVWLGFASDPSTVRVEEHPGGFDVVQDLQALGHLRPGQPQEFGFVSLLVVDGGYWQALAAIQPWLDAVGLKVPADRPRWVEEAVLYCFHPGGTIGSGFTDLGGFNAATQRLLPSIPRLGATAIWVMPIEQKSPYWPSDYFRIMDGLGSGDDYRRLVAEAHRLGLKVWQDLVPHGGSPKAVHNVAHPEFMLKREDGSHLDYWLNDFARPDWQRFMAGVATHWCREAGVDGFRVDACGGSKEADWDPAIPYARASHALLWGGIGMLDGLRQAVRAEVKTDGAILAEVEDARLLGVADAKYDFAFCYAVCQGLRRLPAPAFTAALQEFLEEQRLAEPRGAVRLRHIESHDSLRAERWYGVDGLRALYALGAWIDGMPLIHHGMEVGHERELARINGLRSSRPELARGESGFRTVRCDVPGVFTCLRSLDGRQSVVAINFNREPVQAHLTWPGGSTVMALQPLAYALFPPAPVEAEALWAPQAAARRPGTPFLFPKAIAWFADTISGRLRGTCSPAMMRAANNGGGISWRQQAAGELWRGTLQPLFPGQARLGAQASDGTWTVVSWTGDAPTGLCLLADGDGLRLEGMGDAAVEVVTSPGLPTVPTEAVVGGVRFRCVGSDLILTTAHGTAVLRRQGGVLRELVVGGHVVAQDQDLYGDQEAMSTHHSRDIRAADDVDGGLRIWSAADGLHLAFEGQLRGFERFALKRPPVWYRNHWIIDGSPRLRQTWAFSSENGFQGRPAFLAMNLTLPVVACGRILRGDAPPVEFPIGASGERRGVTPLDTTPVAVRFTGAGRAWGLAAMTAPGSRCFSDGRQFFVTLLDGPGSAMEKGRWYESSVMWDLAEGR